MRRRGLLLAVTQCVFVLLVTVSAQQAPQPSTPPKESILEEVLLAEMTTDDKLSPGAAVLSPDDKHLAWTERRRGKWVVVVNGKQQGAEYESVGHIGFSPDSQHLVVAADLGKGKDTAVLLDGKQQGRQYEKIRGLRFSPDSQHLAFSANRGKNQWVLVVDGQERTPEFYDLVGPVYSRDGQRSAYGACRVKKQCSLTVDGRELEGVYDDIYAPFFSPDGKRVGVPMLRGNNDFHYVLDGREGPGFPVLGTPTFSSDSKRFAYGGTRFAGGVRGITKSKTQGHVVVDGQESAAYEGGVRAGPGFFSTTTLWGGPYTQLSCEVHGVSNPVFSPDGKHVAYAARRGKDDVVMLLDGQPGPQFEDIVTDIAFSPDGAHFAYIVVHNGTYAEVRDGKVSAQFDLTPHTLASSRSPVGELTFSPDGRRLAYVLVRGGAEYYYGNTPRAKRRVIVDSREGKVYNANWVGNLIFSADSRHLAYMVHQDEDDGSLVIVDGREGKRYDSVFMGSLAFQGDTAVSYVVRDGRKFYRVKQPIP